MSVLESQRLSDAVTLHTFTDPRFKTMKVSVNLFLPLEQATAARNAILPSLASRATRAYPDYTALNGRLAQLYGASLSNSVRKMGDFQDLNTGHVKERTCRAVAAEGLPAWLAEYEEKADLLTVALERYNNGRMKRYLCELFLQQDLDTLRRIMARAEALEGADSKELGRAFQALVGEMLES